MSLDLESRTNLIHQDSKLKSLIPSKKAPFSPVRAPASSRVLERRHWVAMALDINIPLDVAMTSVRNTGLCKTVPARKGLSRNLGHFQILYRGCAVTIAVTRMFHSVFLDYPSLSKGRDPEHGNRAG